MVVIKREIKVYEFRIKIQRENFSHAQLLCVSPLNAQLLCVSFTQHIFEVCPIAKHIFSGHMVSNLVELNFTVPLFAIPKERELLHRSAGGQVLVLG